ncbi:hypothetical protein QLQ12_20600 [Actinoplanes sp. NEAU-A12]|uniref:Uncharacterized protein n=1 Tax=Actinoplanes sandaracinus TaxID=3045177 RepID=A0ABT6WMQ2_9ACTN|nr:hypothetical protein [Actinoplanes sandaracinus]MDI6101017.1 hypothetical protein [Actinoplanes sandaracinus]
MTISIGTSHTPSSRETNAAWLLRLREDCDRRAVTVVRATGDGEQEVIADLLSSPAESSGG